MIRNKIASKHQKLIKQCYPPGARGVDKRPNASELSYLLYYVSTRRVKLTKVASFLEKLTRNDISREKFGNVQVTLDIVTALIDRCHEDLNLFAPYVISILLIVLPKSDITLAQHAGRVFATFSKYHNGELFSGDLDYVKAFHELILQFVGLSKRRSSNSTITTSSGNDLDLQWVQISMEAAESASSSVALGTRVGQNEITVLLPPILNTLSLAQDSNGSSLLQLQQQVIESNDEVDEKGVASGRKKSFVVLPPTHEDDQEGTIDSDENDSEEDDYSDDDNEVRGLHDDDESAPRRPVPPHLSSSLSSRTKRLFGHVSNNATNAASYAANVASNTASTAATAAANVVSTTATTAGNAASNAANLIPFPVSSRVSFSSNRVVPSLDDDSNAGLENDILITSLKALVHLFDSTALIQVRHAALSIFSYIMENNSPTPWSNVLIQLITSWTPVQLRFVILSSLVEKFVGLKQENLPLQLKLAHLIKSLLTSSVSMVGLSVMDILRSLLYHQQRFIIADNKQEYRNMIIATRSTIGALGSHNYYSDQISDMIAELLARSIHGGTIGSGALSSNLTTSSKERESEQQKTQPRDAQLAPESTHALIINDLRNVREILDVVAQNKDSYTVRVPLTVWEGTQTLICHDNLKIISEYSSVFCKYLQSDLITIDRNRAVSKNVNTEKLTLNKFIQTSFTTVRDPSSSSQSLIAIYHVLTNIVERFGIHSIIRILPQSWSVQELAIESEHEGSTRGAAISSLVLSILSTIGKELSLAEFTTTVEQDISTRKQAGIWYSPIEVPITNEVSKDIQQVNKFDQQMNLSALSQTEPIDRQVLHDQFTIDNNKAGISEETKSKLFQNIAEQLLNDANGEYNTTAGIQLTKARSLKQLKGGPVSIHSGVSGTRLRLNNTSAIRNGSPGASIESRRDFTPRVNDLRRAVSGAFLNGSPSISVLKQTTIANRHRTNSTNSSSLSVHSASSRFEDDRQNLSSDFRDGIDLDNFLNTLSINSPQRGRLTT